MALMLVRTAPAAETVANGPEQAPAGGSGVVAVPSAPRPAQIEPIVVAPVKREMPKTPQLNTAPATNAAKSKPISPGKSAKAKAGEKVVGDRPNCDAGYRVDLSGKSCVRIAEGESKAKRKGR